MPKAIITLTTDFGLRDPCVAEMKAAILGVCPHAVIVDVTHEVDKFDIRMGAFILASAAPYFPSGAIHVAVVDPDVGTKRRPIIIQTKHGFLAGPNNGVLALAATEQSIKHVYAITNHELMLPDVSYTFHGRDIFAPAAAHLATGTPPSDFGPEIREIVKPKLAGIVRKTNSLVGEVLHVDDFGNIITNFGKKQLKSLDVTSKINVKLRHVKLTLNLCKAYAEAKPKKPLAIIGSHNFLEISLNRGNAAKKYGTKAGDKVELLRA